MINLKRNLLIVQLSFSLSLLTGMEKYIDHCQETLTTWENKTYEWSRTLKEANEYYSTGDLQSALERYQKLRHTTQIKNQSQPLYNCIESRIININNAQNFYKSKFMQANSYFYGTDGKNINYDRALSLYEGIAINQSVITPNQEHANQNLYDSIRINSGDVDLSILHKSRLNLGDICFFLFMDKYCFSEERADIYFTKATLFYEAVRRSSNILRLDEITQASERFLLAQSRLKFLEKHYTILKEANQYYCDKKNSSINYNKALEKYLEISKEAADSKEEVIPKAALAKIQLNIGNIYFFYKKYNEAIEQYKKIVNDASSKLLPRYIFSAALLNLAKAYFNNNAPNEALEVLEKHKEIFYVDAERSLMLGNYYFSNKNYKKALELYEEAIKIAGAVYTQTYGPDAHIVVEALLKIADIYHNGTEEINKDQKKAEEYYRKAIQISKRADKSKINATTKVKIIDYIVNTLKTHEYKYALELYQHIMDNPQELSEDELKDIKLDAILILALQTTKKPTHFAKK